jgi:hypothetical protein
MVHIVDASPQDFLNDIQGKKLFLFGAGKRARYLCDTYNLGNYIEAIIDNDDKLLGNFFIHNNKKIPILGIDYLIKVAKKVGIESLLLLITPVYYGASVIEQLDKISILANLKCYMGRLLDDYYEKSDFSFTVGVDKIPKKIHYCWFGNKRMPIHLERYVHTWREKCPEYKIIKWDESNYDITKNRYMAEAYECQKWGFVPDYARLDIIYNEGGIYLDTDVELISSLDNLLKDKMFCGFNCYGLINLGLGFGAAPHNNFIKKLRDVYTNKSFYNNDKSMNLTSCSWYQHPVFKENGFRINNEYQKKDGIVIYPSEVLAPTGGSGFSENFTDKTVSIHHAELSWISNDAKKEYERGKKILKRRLDKIVN